MKKLVGQVTEEEKNEIQTLFERKNGLKELALIITANNDALYEKVVKDLGETEHKFQNWWNRMAEKYQWEHYESGSIGGKPLAIHPIALSEREEQEMAGDKVVGKQLYQRRRKRVYQQGRNPRRD